MSALIPIASDADATGLVGFITGKSAASLSGQVSQLRNNLEYDYGDILVGASNDGTLFNIRITAKGDYEFGKNLSVGLHAPIGLVDTGDVLSMPTLFPGARFAQSDVARIAHSLLLVAKEEISADDFNSTEAYSGMTVLQLEDALDRLNVDAARPFTINGVRMKLTDGKLSVVSRPGIGGSLAGSRDPELEAIQRDIARTRESLLNNKQEVENVDAAGLTINTLIGIREELEGEYNFVAYDFTENVFVGSDEFVNILPALASIPDGYFVGTNIAQQLNDRYGEDLPEGVKDQIFGATVNYFANLVVGAMTGLPSQLRSEFEDHTRDLLSGLVGDDKKKVDGYIDTIMPTFNKTADNFLDAISKISVGAEIDELREGLGIRSSPSSSTYSLSKYVPAF